MKYLIWYYAFCICFEISDIFIVNLLFKKQFRESYKRSIQTVKDIFNNNPFLKSIRYPVFVVTITAILISCPLIVPFQLYKKIKRLIVGKTAIQKETDAIHEQYEEGQAGQQVNTETEFDICPGSYEKGHFDA